MLFTSFLITLLQGQDIVSVLPPDEGVELYYITFTGIAFGLKVYSMILLYIANDV